MRKEITIPHREQQLDDTRTGIKDAKRRARTAADTRRADTGPGGIERLESQQRVQRQNIFDVEDQTEARRDELLEQKYLRIPTGL